MNCFNNNRPKLSSSDRTANIKSKAIFKANVNDYQKRSSTGISGKCNNYNGIGKAPSSRMQFASSILNKLSSS